MKILELGGAGFVGSHLAEKLLKQGHNVAIVDNLTTGSTQHIPPQARFHFEDIRSPKLEDVFQSEHPDVIIHLAAQKSVPHSVENPSLDADINIMGLINTLTLAIKYEVAKIIFFSTGGALYGNTEQVPTPETEAPQLVSPYAISKYTGEKYVEYYNCLYQILYTIFRPANIFGPRQKPDGECGVIPIYLQNILAERPSHLYTYADMPDGVTRDYVYVEDVVNAVVKSLNQNESNIFNVGSGVETSTKDIYTKLQDITGTNQPLIQEKERAGDVRRSALDITRAETLLGWVAQVSLAAGLEETVKYETGE